MKPKVKRYIQRHRWTRGDSFRNERYPMARLLKANRAVNRKFGVKRGLASGNSPRSMKARMEIGKYL